MRLGTSEQIICEVFCEEICKEVAYGVLLCHSASFDVESGQRIINNRGVISAHVAQN